MKIRQSAVGVVEKSRLLRGKFAIEHIRNGEVLNCIEMPNGIVDVGLNHILDTEFVSGAQITTWYIGLVDNAAFSAFADADTMASHTGWAESSAYSDGTRPEWGPDAADSRAVSNTTTADFNIDDTATIKGLFVTSNNTKGGSTGTLWSTAAFGSTVNVADGDVLKVTYTVSG